MSGAAKATGQKKAEVRVSLGSSIDYYDARSEGSVRQSNNGLTKTGTRTSQMTTQTMSARASRPTHRRTTLREQEKAREAEKQRQRKPPPPRCISCSRCIVENKVFITLTTLLTIYALMGDDIRLIATEKPADPVFNGITISCIVIFTVEVILSCFGKDDYFGGFFFTLDVISTGTLLFDLTWVNDQIQGDEEDLENLRGSRTARIGARTARVVRVLRLVRILKLYKAVHEARQARKKHEERMQRQIGMVPGEEDLWDDTGDADFKVESMQRESRVGKRLSELTTRRVILLVLTMMLALPLLRADTSQQLPFSASYGADLVHEAFHRYQRCSDTICADAATDPCCSDDDTTVQETVKEYQNEYVNQMLQYVYYHNWYTGNAEECPIPENLCSKEYYNYVFWIGIVSQDSSYDFESQVQLSSLPLDDVVAFNTKAENDKFIFNFGGLPPEVQRTVGSNWMTQVPCNSKNNKIFRRGFSLLSHEIPDKVNYVVECPDDLRIVERTKFSARIMTRDEAKVWHFGFYFDKRVFTRLEAKFSLIITVFVCFVLCLASLFFSNDADKLVLNPVEIMISRVEKIRDNPLMAMKMSDEEFRQEEVRKQKERMQEQNKWQIAKDTIMCTSKSVVSEPMETVILEKTIIKIGSLLALGFGEAGANIIEHNMHGVESAMVTAMVEGTRVECIIGCARIRDFSTATEVLRGNVMTFVNQIAEIVHGVVDEFHGAANKNNGDMFLLIWRTSDLDDGYSSKLADMAMLAFTRILGAVHRSPVLASYRSHPGLQQRMGKNCRVNLSFSLHYGWAIEGAVGSEFKIDASYLSPNVSIAESLEGATLIYSVSILVSESVIGICTPEMAAKCRLIDRVLLTGQTMELYVIDLDYMSLMVEQPPVGHITWNPRQRFRVRQFLEAEKAMKWCDEVQIVSYFNENPDVATMRFRYTLEFTHVFNMGYQNYSEGEWQVAQRFLSLTRTMLGVEDGPSAALLRYMEIPYKFEKPPTWKGIRDLGHDNLG
mmetsp:Transcript_28338/g.50177  ORF Transcript_28338/g.50177 Transcript_28338/m.50177 type:complete len:1006 (+) Transcript_28338:66-3083(+)